MRKFPLVPIALLFTGIALAYPASFGDNSAQPPQESTISAVDSVKDLQSLCIGSIAGDPIEVGVFIKELQNWLPREGFSVSNNTKACDAIIEGHLRLDPVRTIWGKHNLTFVEITLLNQNHQPIWSETLKPFRTDLWGARVKDRRISAYSEFGTYTRDRAIDLATFLKADKKRLVHAAAKSK